MYASNFFNALGALFVALALSSCAVTTDSTESTTETFENTTDASSDFTSSTSPRDKHDHSARSRINEFAAANFERLREDMALGSGEHLAALADLLQISEVDRPVFYQFIKARFSTWFGSDRISAEDWLAKFMTDLADRPELQAALP